MKSNRFHWKFSISLLHRRERRFRDAVHAVMHTGEPKITPKKAESLTRAAWRVLRTAECVPEGKDALASFMRTFVGRSCDPDTEKHLLARLTGWAEAFCAGLPFKEWNESADPCWNLLYAESVERIPHRTMKLYDCRLVVKAGRASGREFALVLPGGFLQQAVREAGAAKYSKWNAEDFGGLLFIAQLHMTQGRVMLNNIRVNSSAEKRNKDILAVRSSGCLFDDRACWPCWRGRDMCPYSRHLRTYKKGKCILETPYPHENYIVRQGLCITCLIRGRVPGTGRKDYGRKESSKPPALLPG